MSDVFCSAVLARRGFVLGLGALCIAPGVLAQTVERDLAFPLKVAAGAELRATKAEVNDPAYVVLAYPMGDVPDDRGVCTDTVIRAFRSAGVDLQVEVNQDMAANFAAYPKIWGLTRPDRNIDHRRVPNLETYFKRKGGAKTLSTVAADYRAPLARISVRFSADIAAVTRSREGVVIGGSLNDAVDICDLWTFSRNVQSGSPDWLVDETDEG